MTIRQRLAAMEEITGKTFRAFEHLEAINAEITRRGLPEVATYETETPKNLGIPTNDVILIGETHGKVEALNKYPKIITGLKERGYNTLSCEFPDTPETQKVIEKIKEETAKPEAKVEDIALDNGWPIELVAGIKEGLKIILSDHPEREQPVEFDIDQVPNEPFDPTSPLSVFGYEAHKKTSEDVKAYLDTQDQALAKNIERAAKDGKTMHFGGAVHNPKLQDIMGGRTGNRPLSLIMGYPDQERKTPLPKHSKKCGYVDDVLKAVDTPPELTLEEKKQKAIGFIVAAATNFAHQNPEAAVALFLATLILSSLIDNAIKAKITKLNPTTKQLEQKLAVETTKPKMDLRTSKITRTPQPIEDALSQVENGESQANAKVAKAFRAGMETAEGKETQSTPISGNQEAVTKTLLETVKASAPLELASVINIVDIKDVKPYFVEKKMKKEGGDITMG